MLTVFYIHLIKIALKNLPELKRKNLMLVLSFKRKTIVKLKLDIDKHENCMKVHLRGI